MRLGSALFNEEHVVRNASVSGFAVVGVGINRGFVAKPIAELIGAPGLLITQGEGVHAQFWKTVQLVWLRYAIVIFINPQNQMREDLIPTVDDTVAVAAALRLVELGQRQETVRIAGLGLLGHIAEEFSAAVDLSIVVPVQRQERIP